MKTKTIFIICLIAAAIVIFKLSLVVLNAHLISDAAFKAITFGLMAVGALLYCIAWLLKAKTAKKQV